MAVMDEFKEERERMKSQPFKERLAYFWDYYKWHVLATVAIICCVVSYAYNMITAKDISLHVALIDCYCNEESMEEYRNELIDSMGLNPKKQTVHLDNSFLFSSADTLEHSMEEVFSLKVIAKEIDVMLSHEDIFDRYVQNDIFADLRDYLSPEQLEYYQDSFYYVDYAIIESEAIYNTDFAENPFVDNANHRSPEGMEKPIPVGIYVTGTEDFQGHYYFVNKSQEVVFGLMYYVEDPSYALQFLDNMSGRVK